MLIHIGQDAPLDKVLVLKYSNLLKEKYGKNVTIQWSRNASSETVRARNKKSDTNITIVIVK